MRFVRLALLAMAVAALQALSALGQPPDRYMPAAETPGGISPVSPVTGRSSDGSFEPLPDKIGALPVAADRVARPSPRPLPIQNKWQHVAVTFDPREVLAAPPAGYRIDGSDDPSLVPYGDLWSYYHNVNDRWWLRIDYLRWRVQGYDIPALVIQGPANTPLVDVPDLPVVFGDDRIEEGHRHGGRIRLGHWLVDGQFKGYQAEYFSFEREQTGFFRSGQPGDFILARPFIRVDPGPTLVPDASIIVGENVVIDNTQTDIAGEIDIRTHSDIHSAALTRRHVLWADFETNCRIDSIVGYRWFRLDEAIRIQDIVEIQSQVGIFPPGSRFRRIDRFGTTNDYHALDLGLYAEKHRGRWSVEGYGKVGFSYVHSVVDVAGSLAIDPTLGQFIEVAGAGGLLAQPGTNIGRHIRDDFAIIPEGEINLVYQVNDRLRVHLGYNLLYINRIARPGDQIDLLIDPQFVPPNQPAPGADPFPRPLFVRSDFWMHGMSAGAEWRW
jgi:hypothetical protein